MDEFDPDIDQVYNNYWTVHNTVIEQGNDPLAIAAILIAQGLSLYRTILSPEDYERMVDAISETRDLVQIIGDNTLQ